MRFLFDFLWIQVGLFLRKADYPRLMAIMTFDGRMMIFMWVSILGVFPITNLSISPDIVSFHRGLLGAVADNN